MPLVLGMMAMRLMTRKKPLSIRGFIFFEPEAFIYPKAIQFSIQSPDLFGAYFFAVVRACLRLQTHSPSLPLFQLFKPSDCKPRFIRGLFFAVAWACLRFQTHSPSLPLRGVRSRADRGSRLNNFEIVPRKVPLADRRVVGDQKSGGRDDA